MSEMELQFSAELSKLAAALAAAQGAIEDAKKDAANPHFKAKYATLASIRTAITPSFSKNGLSYVQLNEPHGMDGVMIVTLLLHSSGQWIRSRLFVPVSKKDAQGFGSALTYGRRYALAQISGIAFEDEDDATEAVKTSAPPAEKKSEPSIDVVALDHDLSEAANAEELKNAILAVQKVKDKLSKKDLESLMATRERRVRELGTSERAA
jgi:hypothetical protein